MNTLYNNFTMFLRVGNEYVPFSNQEQSFWSSTDESLNEEENSKYTLSFQIPMHVQHDRDAYHPLYRYFYIGNYIKLQWNQQEIIFIISNISFDNNQESLVYTVTAQDEPSYKWSRINVGMSYRTENEEGILATLNIYQIAQNVLDLCHLSKTTGGEWSLPIINSDPNTPQDDFLDYKELHTQRITLDIEDSNPYEIIIEACNTLNAYMKIDHKQHKIDFYRKTNVQNSGYRYNGNNNLVSHTINTSGEELCTMLHVTGGEDADGNIVGLVPPIPTEIQNYVEKITTFSKHPLSDMIEWPKDSNNIIYITEPWVRLKSVPTDLSYTACDAELLWEKQTLYTQNNVTKVKSTEILALCVFAGEQVYVNDGVGSTVGIYKGLSDYTFEPYLVHPSDTIYIPPQDNQYIILLSFKLFSSENLSINIRIERSDGSGVGGVVFHSTIPKTVTAAALLRRTQANAVGGIISLTDSTIDNLEELKTFEPQWHLYYNAPDFYMSMPWTATSVTTEPQTYILRLPEDNVIRSTDTYEIDYKYKYHTDDANSIPFQPYVNNTDYLTLYRGIEQTNSEGSFMSYQITHKEAKADGYNDIDIPSSEVVAAQLPADTYEFVFSCTLKRGSSINIVLGKGPSPITDVEGVCHAECGYNSSYVDNYEDRVSTDLQGYSNLGLTIQIKNQECTIYSLGKRLTSKMTQLQSPFSWIIIEGRSVALDFIKPVFYYKGQIDLPSSYLFDTTFPFIGATLQAFDGPIERYSNNTNDYYVLPYTSDAGGKSYSSVVLSYNKENSKKNQEVYIEEASNKQELFFKQARQLPYLDNFLLDFSFFKPYIAKELWEELYNRSQNIFHKALVYKVLLQQYYNYSYDLNVLRTKLELLGDNYDQLLADYASAVDVAQQTRIVQDINSVISNIRTQGQIYKNTCSILGQDNDNQLSLAQNKTKDLYFDKILASGKEQLYNTNIPSFFITSELRRLEYQVIGRRDIKIQTSLDTEPCFPRGSRVLLKEILDSIDGVDELCIAKKTADLGEIVKQFHNFIRNNFSPYLYESVYNNTTELDSVSLFNQALQYFTEISQTREQHTMEVIDILSLENINVPKLSVGNFITIFNPHSLQSVPYAHKLSQIYAERMRLVLNAEADHRGLLQMQETLAQNYNADHGFTDSNDPRFIHNFAQLESVLYNDEVRITSITRVLREPLKDSITVEEPSRYKTILSKLIKSI